MTIEWYPVLVLVSLIMSFFSLIIGFTSLVLSLSIKWSTHKAYLMPIDDHLKQIDTKFEEKERDIERDLDSVFSSVLDNRDQL